MNSLPAWVIAYLSEAKVVTHEAEILQPPSMKERSESSECLHTYQIIRELACNFAIFLKLNFMPNSLSWLTFKKSEIFIRTATGFENAKGAWVEVQLKAPSAEKLDLTICLEKRKLSQWGLE